ncbi:WD40 repeat domain-containing protein [Persephonella sp.]
MRKLLLHRVIFLLIITIEYSFAVSSQLVNTGKVDGAISDLRYKSGKIYIATERGKVEILDFKTLKKIKVISYPKFEDFRGELQLPKVFSVDISPDEKKIVAVIQTTRGGREVYLFEDGKLQKIIDRRKHLQITRLRFVDNNLILFGLGGDELVLYDIEKDKIIYREPVGMSFFSDMEVNDEKSMVAIADESGDTKIADVKTGKVIKVIQEMNKDKAFDVDFRNKRVMTGGRDKKAVYYNLKTDHYTTFPADDFMVFSVALSPSGNRGAYLYNDKFDVRIVDTEEGKILTTLSGHKATPSNMRFVDENQLIIGCDDGKLYIWRIEP